MDALEDSFHVYSFYSSSCCQRIIIAAHLKSIPLTFSYVYLGSREHHADQYKNVLNPSASVPTLVVTDAHGKKTTIRQSVAILEYFEERFPDRCPLLPPASRPEERALVRDFVGIITNDVQPVTNSRITRRVKAIRDQLDDQVSFVRDAFVDGLGAYEALFLQTQEESDVGGFSVGSGITMADVVLVPAVDQALIYRLDLQYAPNVVRIYNHLKQMAAFQAADWRKQEDTPQRYRQ